MSDIDELRDRLDVVEDQVTQLTEDAAATRALTAMADRDVAAFRHVMRGHTLVLNAIRETQVEQGRALHSLRETQVEQGRALHSLRETQVEQGRTSAKQGETLAKQGETFARQGETLARQGETLAEHGQVLETLADGQAAIMRHLGIANHDNGEQTHD